MLKSAGFRVLTMPPATPEDNELLQVLKTTPRFGLTQDNGNTVIEYSSQSDYGRPVELFILDEASAVSLAGLSNLDVVVDDFM